MSGENFLHQHYNEATPSGETPLLDKLAPADSESESVLASRAALLTFAESTAAAHMMAEVRGDIEPEVIKRIDEQLLSNIGIQKEQVYLVTNGVTWDYDGTGVDSKALCTELIAAGREDAASLVIESIDGLIAAKEAEIAHLLEARSRLEGAHQPDFEFEVEFKPAAMQPTIIEASELPAEPAMELAIEAPHTPSSELKIITAQLRHVGGHLLHVAGFRS